MGGRSAKLQKQIFPRSRTKMEVLKDKLTGNKNEYPSIKASQYLEIDPAPTPQYSDMLKHVATNISTKDQDTKFKDFSMNTKKQDLEPGDLALGKAPPGYLTVEMLTRLFTTDKELPNLHHKYALTEDELSKIFSWYTGYKTTEQSTAPDLDLAQQHASSLFKGESRENTIEMLKEKESERMKGDFPKSFLNNRWTHNPSVDNVDHSPKNPNKVDHTS